MRERLILVSPRNYRRIALHAISVARAPVVLLDGERTTDFSERGRLTQRGIRSCIDLEIRDGRRPILGFHDHPGEMWVTQAYAQVAEHCARQGWLEIEATGA